VHFFWKMSFKQNFWPEIIVWQSMSASTNIQETHPLFPSGDWEGFYTYHQGPDAHRHMKQFTLEFRDNVVVGRGSDDVGSFRWKGVYDTQTLRCRLTKFYITHTVEYDGYVDENGIWGMWNIRRFGGGGFHFWPVKNEEEAVLEAVKAAVEEADLKGVRVI